MTGTQRVTVTAECGDHTASVRLPVREIYGNSSAWLRCATCGGIHHATVGGDSL